MAKNNSPKKINIKDDKDFLIVGIGASAGGIKALREFFAAMPADSGMAFVVILHLSQTHKSNLAEILQRKTKMKVEQVEQTVKVEPDKVYVIPPAKHLEMVDGVITLKEPQRIKGIRVPIDRFFRTMADAYGRKAVCIILSGTGSDGTMGLKHVKGRDGFAIIQDPEDAEYEGMPRSAIETKIADVVLPVAAMPEKLMFVRNTTKKWRLTDGNEGAVAGEIKNIDLLRDVLTLLRVRTGHDFSNYKRPTLIRRLARHLQIHETDDLKQYLDILRKKPDEVLSLLKNLLINVTNFFRDKKAFAALEKKIIPALFTGKSANDEVRVWIAGCSTGEEAYSMAILLSEYAATLTSPPKIQIFASDVDMDAIAEAREGRFSEAVVADVSSRRLRQFFVKHDDNTYQVRKTIRELILFAPHNILRDPPFSRLDLVSCRNVLIYLNRETQEQVLKVFHFALDEGGYLFLGSSETADGASKHFSTINKQYRIYQCRPSDTGWKTPPALPMPGVWMPNVQQIQMETRDNLQSFGELHHRLIEHYAPPSVLVNEEGDILHLSENAGRFLHFVGGEPTANIIKVVHPALLSDVRAALFTARKENKIAEAKNIRVKFNGHEKFVNITVRPIGTPEASALIMFEETSNEPVAEESVHAIVSGDKAMEAVVRRMEDELKHTKDQLRNTIEQYETSTEELKASNEELQAINEELRSASEELETSKEEIQSVNEELTTVNHELKDKVEEVSRSNSDLQNLIRSTDIATIFLDRSLNIKRYTPPTTEIFNVIPGDIGRPLSHITHQLSPDNFQKDAAKVLQSLQPLEREVRSTEGRIFIARFSPYRTMEDKIDGVVIALIDVTEREKSEQVVREARAYAEAIIRTVREPLIVLDKSLCVVSANRSFYKTFKVLSEESEGKYIYDLGNGQWDIPKLRELLENILTEKSEFQDFEVEHEFESIGRRTMLLNAREIRREDEGRRLILLAITDISEQKREEERQAFLLKLSDTLRPIADAVSIEETVTKIALDYFEADRCYYCTIEKDVAIVKRDAFRGNLPSAAASYPLSDFALFRKAIYKGRPLIVHNSHTTEILDEGLREIVIGLQIISFIIIPVVKNGKTVGLFCLTQSNPRNWTKTEVHVAAETSERIWASVERARAEDALRKSEQKYRMLINSLDDAFCIIEMIFDDTGKPVDFRYLETNPAFVRHATMSMQGKRIKELIPNFEQFWLDQYGKVAKTGEVVRLESIVEGLGNQWFQTSAFRLADDGSNKVGVLFQNITARKHEEEKQFYLLKLNEAIRSISDPVDLEEAVTQAAMNYFGADRCYYCDIENGNATIRRDAYRGSLPSVSGVYPLNNFALFKAVVDAGHPFIINDVHKTDKVDEELRRLCIQLQVISFVDVPLIKNGKPAGILCLVQSTPRDWTDIEVESTVETAKRVWMALEKAKTEAALQESEKNYRVIVNQAIAGVLKADLSGNIIFTNDQMTKMLGYNTKELMQLSLADIVHKEDKKRNNELFIRLKTEGMAYEIEKRLIRKDRTYIWVNNQVSPIFDNNHIPNSAVIISVDITDQKAIEKQKDDFIGIASHELKTPLTSIKIYAELLQDLFSESEEPASYDLAAKLNIQVDRLVKLIYGLLDTNRISGGRLTLQLETFDLNRLIEERVTESQMTSPDHRLIFEPGDIAPVYADRERIGQVITNLIANAIKYSPDANRVIISTVNINNEVKVSVRDFGIGVDPDMQQKIFKRFYRMNVSDNSGGLGLGLYISMEIIKMHGRVIAVESPPGKGADKPRKGSLFYFTLSYATPKELKT